MSTKRRIATLSGAELDPRYVAGLFDGEGWISVAVNQSGYTNVHIGIAMKHSVVADVHDKYGGSLRIRKDGLYQVDLQGKRDALRFLQDIKGHLRVKRRVAELAEQHLLGSLEEREPVAAKILALNARGKKYAEWS